jgi:hypothetical protein
VVEQTVTEVPAGLDEGGPCLVVAAAVDSEAPGTLERPDGRFGGGAVAAYLGPAGREAGGAEAALKVTDSFAGVSRPQREPVGRNSFNSSSNWPLPLAPINRLRSSPSEKTSSVGMLITS